MKFRHSIFVVAAILVLADSAAICGEKDDAAEAAEAMDSFVCKLSQIQFDDGDSFRCGGEDIRVLGVDTPEIRHEGHGIFTDQEYGREAAAFTENALKKASRIVITRGGKDPYGRTLAHVMVDGELLSVKLVRAGLGYENISRYGTNGFPLFAADIKDVAENSPRPKFQDPHLWRKANQKKTASALVKR